VLVDGRWGAILSRRVTASQSIAFLGRIAVQCTLLIDQWHALALLEDMLEPFCWFSVCQSILFVNTPLVWEFELISRLFKEISRP
jgi:hypothetical protein